MNTRPNSSQLLINLSVILPQPTGISNYALNLIPYLKTLQPTLLTPKTTPILTVTLFPLISPLHRE
jgi:hypothetical protein